MYLLITKNIILISVIITTIVIIGLLINYFSEKQKIIRTLKALPLKSIGSMQTNTLTRLTGKAKSIDTPLIAPYSKRQCVFYQIRIERQQKRGKNSHWKTILNEENIQDFFIEKNGDFALIKPSLNPKNFLSHLVIDKKTSSGTFNDASDSFKELLDKYQIKSTNFLGFNKQIRCYEAIIEIDEEITVAGITNSSNLDKPLKGYSYSKIASLESTINQKLIITNLKNIKYKRQGL